MKVLVFGGRDYQDRERVNACLDSLLAEHGDALIIIHGRCRTGADNFADEWADKNEVDCVRVPAKWMKYSNSAGPIRNIRMADLYKPDRAIRFPGGRGTEDMAKNCAEYGIPVTEYAS